MRLHSVSVRTTDSAIRLVGEADSQRYPDRFELYFEYPIEFEDFVQVSADPFAVAMLVPAMQHGEPLEIAPPISPRLHFHLPRVRDIFNAWHPELKRIPFQSTAGTAAAGPVARRAATFFSGGVDSFYTLLKHRRDQVLPSPLTHTIFMRGIEKPLDFARGVEESQQRAVAISESAGVRCITGESNIRTWFDADWLNHYSGSGLAATALSLGAGFSHVCIPATYSYAAPVPIGSTPLTDERYSTEQVQVVHDGAELPRPEKTAKILEWDRDLVLKYLRVCTMNYGGAYNCCDCRKCVRTLVPLRFLGALAEAPTFPNKSPARWGALAETDALPWIEENLAFGRRLGTDPELAALLERIVRRLRRKKAIEALFENSPVPGLLPRILEARRWVRRRLQRRAPAA